MASSTIMYKFRSSTTFEPLAMPGTSARLFDVKRAIVVAKKLDRSAGGNGLEFDLSVRNAMTNEEYSDESMLLPRGTRVVVQRLPAARGHGILSKIARVDAGMSMSMMRGTNMGIGAGKPRDPRQQPHVNSIAAQNGYYTIDSTKTDDQDEFVDSGVSANSSSNKNDANDGNNNNTGEDMDENAEERELAAVMAVTDAAGSAFRPHNAFSRSAGLNHMQGVATSSGISKYPGTTAGVGGMSNIPHMHFNKLSHLQTLQRERPNADPELRELESKQDPQRKKRATGIPRTFLSLSAPPSSTDEANIDKDRNSSAVSDTGSTPSTELAGLSSRLQPNNIGFQALINRGGGQSESLGDSNANTLDYALKLTATTIPEHLQCGVCHGVVKNAMLIPWDAEGRAACESCMRDSLAQNGFCCPLTGHEGVSPDDILPNHGLRKAADLFVNNVMEKMEEIVVLRKQEEREEEIRANYAEAEALKQKALQQKQQQEQLYKGEDSLEKGVVVSGRKHRGKTNRDEGEGEDDDFYGEEDFGGDIFDVSNKEDDINEKEIDKDDMFGTNVSAPTDKNINVEDDNKKIVSTLNNNENQVISREEGNNEAENSENKNTEKIGIVSSDDLKINELKSKKNSHVDGNAIDASDNSNNKLNLNYNNHGEQNVDNIAQPVRQESSNLKDKKYENLSQNNNINTSDPENHSKFENATTGKHSTKISNKRYQRPIMSKPRGPPAGYMMGPAGGALLHGNPKPFVTKPFVVSTNDFNTNPTNIKNQWNNISSENEGTTTNLNRNCFHAMQRGGKSGRGRGGGMYNQGQQAGYRGGRGGRNGNYIQTFAGRGRNQYQNNRNAMAEGKFEHLQQGPQHQGKNVEKNRSHQQNNAERGTKRRYYDGVDSESTERRNMKSFKEDHASYMKANSTSQHNNIDKHRTRNQGQVNNYGSRNQGFGHHPRSKYNREDNNRNFNGRKDNFRPFGGPNGQAPEQGKWR
mmetsp:Transcript_18152/g.25632  ORF Transcript_18152/g.25632 Transcript_18152/m.25632 type:complete len:978 (+) Transcript_18152:300-3233(+)|eukprot:CAMPEP_0184855580 /NCGR_PEP_ID=MMETSP0580-20130426/781_1 /TAXON_ID=1118495 /ORGANISM="Dactyliosolen fragilissimus" /LENGTH=977 /DNA_ID=CAMNT_0027350129 /DNA_START=625 /DNA_END=3558 /DNA_ORIENTATION=+